MKIMLKVTLAGPTVFWGADTVQEVSDDEARSLIAAGYAEAVTDETEKQEEPAPPQPVDRAVDPVPEVVAERRPGRGQKTRR